MIVIYKNELYHHGIEGQKWGVRNGPPYPLNRDVKDSINRAKSSAKSYFTASNNLDTLFIKRNKLDKARIKNRKEGAELNKAISDEYETMFNSEDDFFREINDAEYRLRSGNAGKTSMESILEDQEILNLYEQFRESIAKYDHDGPYGPWTSSQIVWSIARSYNREMPELDLDDIVDTINTRTHNDWLQPLIEKSYLSIKRA